MMLETNFCLSVFTMYQNQINFLKYTVFFLPQRTFWADQYETNEYNLSVILRNRSWHGDSKWNSELSCATEVSQLTTAADRAVWAPISRKRFVAVLLNLWSLDPYCVCMTTFLSVRKLNYFYKSDVDLDMSSRKRKMQIICFMYHVSPLKPRRFLLKRLLTVCIIKQLFAVQSVQSQLMMALENKPEQILVHQS